MISVLNIYHFKRCDEENCSYCSFLDGLFLIYDELTQTNNDDISRLKFYCVMTKEVFIASRLYIHRLAKIELQRLELGKEFQEIRSSRNSKKDYMVSPHFWSLFVMMFFLAIKEKNDNEIYRRKFFKVRPGRAFN